MTEMGLEIVSTNIEVFVPSPEIQAVIPADAPPVLNDPELLAAALAYETPAELVAQNVE